MELTISQVVYGGMYRRAKIGNLFAEAGENSDCSCKRLLVVRVRIGLSQVPWGSIIMTMTSSVPSGPGRDQIMAWWTALIKGLVTREATHAWAAQWVENEEANISDPMVTSALQNLHGFDLSYLPGKENITQHGMSDTISRYMYSSDEIASEFARWIDNCSQYDESPDEYSWKLRIRALESEMNRRFGNKKNRNNRDR